MQRDKYLIQHTQPQSLGHVNNRIPARVSWKICVLNSVVRETQDSWMALVPVDVYTYVYTRLCTIMAIHGPVGYERTLNLTKSHMAF